MKKKTQIYLEELSDDIFDNMKYYLEIIPQFCRQGVKYGKYTKKDNEFLRHYEDNL